MDQDGMNRRRFNQLSIAAFGGMLAGANITLAAEEKNPLLSEPHVCRGLNTCKGTFGGKENQCAGTGACATAKAHTCASKNECKGQGGCGGHPGENACTGKGGCAVPLHESAWKKARARFEELMKAEGKKVGPAPAKG